MPPSVPRVNVLASRLGLPAVVRQSHMQQRFMLSVGQSNEGAVAWQSIVSAHSGCECAFVKLDYVIVSSWAPEILQCWILCPANVREGC